MAKNRPWGEGAEDVKRKGVDNLAVQPPSTLTLVGIANMVEIMKQGFELFTINKSKLITQRLRG